MWLCGFYYRAFHVEPCLAHCSRVFFLRGSFEPRHDKTNKMSVRPAKTQISLSIHPVWSEFSLCAQLVAKDPGFLHADSEDSDQTRRIPRLIWVFAGRTFTLLVLSCRGSFQHYDHLAWGICVSRAFVCLFCTLWYLSFFSSSWCRGLVAASDCDTPWTFLLAFIEQTLRSEHDQNGIVCPYIVLLPVSNLAE